MICTDADRGRRFPAIGNWRAVLGEAVLHTEPSHARDAWCVPGLGLGGSQALSASFPRAPRPAAVMIPVIDHPAAPTILLTTRATGLRNHAGQISFPGGSLEAGESPFDGAMREAREEIGLGSDWVSLLGYLPDHILLSGFRVTPVVCIIRPGFALLANATEVHDVFEVPLLRLLDMPAYEVHQRRDEGKVEVPVYSLSFEGREIWGATAGMLRNLARRCAGHDV